MIIRGTGDREPERSAVKRLDLISDTDSEIRQRRQRIFCFYDGIGHNWMM